MSYIVRRVTVELVYDEDVDVSLEGFREYAVSDVVEWGSVIYDEVEGVPDEMPTGE